MTLKEYLKGLNQLVQDHPEALDFPVIYASDDEGNAFHQVFCNGTLAIVEDPKEYYLELLSDEDDKLKYNAVIIN